MPHRPTIDEEVDGELDHHLRMRERELMAQGRSEAEARRLALQKFGSIETARRQCVALGIERERRMRTHRWFPDLARDLVIALRQMAAARAFTCVAVATLAIGIGGTTAIFSAVHSVILRPLPVPDPHRIFVIGETWQGARAANVSAGNFVDMAAEQTAFESVAAATIVNATLSREGGAERMRVGRVSASFFDVFRTGAARGRVFTADEDQPGRDQVVVLSHRFWTRELGSDPRAVGTSLTLNGRLHEIVGVMPAEFDFTADAESMWVPIAFTPEERAQHDEHYLDVYGRLRSGVTADRAAAELAAIGARLAQRFPQENAARSLTMLPLMDVFVGDAEPRLLVLLGAVGFVLLIACGNVSSLLLARGASRARELALRGALGASRGRLVRQLFAESLALGLISAAAGVALAYALLQLLVSAAPAGVPRLDQAHIDGTALAVAASLGLICSVMFGFVPAWRAARIDLLGALREGGRGAGSRTARDGVRSALIAIEVALAVMLLVGAGLLVRSAIEMRRRDPGFNAAGVFSARLTLPVSTANAAQLQQTASEIEAGVAAIPAVRSAAVSTAVPGFGSFYNGVLPEGERREAGSARDSRSRFVSPAFFETMAVPIRRGRPFLETDRAGTMLVAIVNEHLAARLFPGEDPVGRRLLCCNVHPKTIVGVAADVRAGGPAQPIESELYLPLAQIDDEAWGWTRGNLFVVARSANNASMLAPAVRAVVTAVNPSVPLFSVMTMEQRMAQTVQTERFNTMLLVALGGVGLLLAAVGIYSVVAYFAAQQSSEIGIRLALGARRASVLALVVRQAALPVAAGVVLGGLGAVYTTKFLAAQLVDVQPTDPATFAAGVLALGAVAAAAALIPARRAARLDPATTLRL